jgi:hypothetical protein
MTFNEPINPTTFTAGEIHLADGHRNIHLRDLTVTPVAGSNNTQFLIQFAPLTVRGSYVLTIGPHIKDLYGHQMDQDGNFIEGEDSDVFTLVFEVQRLPAHHHRHSGHDHWAEHQEPERPSDGSER